jgi:hypothetical protein
MLLSTTVFHCLLAALLPHLSPTLATDDGWHLDFIYTLVTEELDPVVSPNAEGSHMHKVIGGSRFGASYNYAEYSAANCSSLRLQADKSNYWMPGGSSHAIPQQSSSSFATSRRLWRRLESVALTRCPNMLLSAKLGRNVCRCFSQHPFLLLQRSKLPLGAGHSLPQGTPDDSR